jgi:hypothetical protein
MAGSAAVDLGVVAVPSVARRPAQQNSGQDLVRGDDIVVAGGRPTRGEVGTWAALLVAGIGIPVLLALWAHAFAIPRNDDWAYRRAMFEFARTGHFAPVGWGSMTLVGQVLWATPFVLVFGAHAWVPGFSVAVAAAIGLTCAYVAARSCLGRRPAAACAFALLALPGFVLNTSSFMTDVPAFAAEMACLVMGMAALRRRGRPRWAWLAGAMAVGAFGFSIRDFDLAAPVAVLVVLAGQDRRHLGFYLSNGAALASVCGTTYLWTSQLPGVQHKALGPPSLYSLQVLAGAFFTLAFVISPLLPAMVRRSWRSAPPLAPALAAVALAVGLWLISRHDPVLMGNYLTQKGATASEVLGGARPDLFPAPIWQLLQLLAVAAGAALAFVAVARGRGRGRRPGPALGELRVVRAFTALSAVGLVCYGLFVQAPLWDRYLWPVAFGAGITILGRARSRRLRAPAPPSPGLRGLAVALAVPAIATALMVTLNADAYDGARWSAGQDAVAAGYGAATVDAGFEWVGAHATSMAQPGRHVAPAPAYETWYDQMFPSFSACAFVSGSPFGGPTIRLLGVITYNAILVAVPEHIYLYAVRGPHCP